MRLSVDVVLVRSLDMFVLRILLIDTWLGVCVGMNRGHVLRD